MKIDKIKNILLYSFLFLICSSFVNVAFGQDFWEVISPPSDDSISSTNIRDISRIKSNASGELFCTTLNGVYKSTDDGINWELVGLEGLPTTCLEINPITGYIYVAQYKDILYLSKDNGVTWNKTEFENITGISCIHSSKNNDLFVGNWWGIHKSTDCGNTWNYCVLQANIDGFNVTQIIETKEGILFASVTSFMGGGGVYRSDDNGDNWEHIGLDNDYVSTLTLNSEGTLFAGSFGNYHTGQGGVYKSVDLGQTWELCNPKIDALSLAIDGENTLYAGIYYDFGVPMGVFRSTDEGVTWEHLISGMSDARIDYVTMSHTGYLFATNTFYRFAYRSVKPVTTGIFENPAEISLKIYPNPFTDRLQIDGLTSNRATISICDIQGREVYRGNYTGNTNTINLSNLLPGVYILNVKADDK
jgi:photosystem II stability/assembly factor-like uncharacterized protein